MLKQVLSVFASLVVGGILMGGCVSPIDTSPALVKETTPSALPTQTLALSLTHSVTPTVKLTSHTPMPSLTPTATASQTSTPQPTPLPTWTPLPTLLSDEASQLVQELLVNNAGCKLPCWWGFIPGKTTWLEAEHLLATFIPEIIQGGVSGQNTNYDTNYEVQGRGYGPYTNYAVNAGIISGISVEPPATEMSYLLHQLLSVYGQPDEVVIQTFPNTPIDYLPFWLILFYPDQGIYAFYEYHAEKQGDLLLGCSQTIGPELFLWNPDEALTLGYINTFVLGQPSWIPRPLEEVTQMDLETFYHTFKEENSNSCIETPASLWP